MSEKSKKEMSELAKTATSTPSDDFWRNVQAEANRLDKNPKKPEIKARPTRHSK